MIAMRAVQHQLDAAISAVLARDGKGARKHFLAASEMLAALAERMGGE